MAKTFLERIVTLEANHRAMSDVQHTLGETQRDVEMRLRRIERNMYILVGCLAVLQVVIKVIGLRYG